MMISIIIAYCSVAVVFETIYLYIKIKGVLRKFDDFQKSFMAPYLKSSKDALLGGSGAIKFRKRLRLPMYFIVVAVAAIPVFSVMFPNSLYHIIKKATGFRTPLDRKCDKEIMTNRIEEAIEEVNLLFALKDPFVFDEGGYFEHAEDNSVGDIPMPTI